MGENFSKFPAIVVCSRFSILEQNRDEQCFQEALSMNMQMRTCIELIRVCEGCIGEVDVSIKSASFETKAK